MEWMCFINAQSKLGATSVVHAVMQQMRKAQSEDLHEACEVSILSSDTDHTPGSCSLCECKETILQHGSIFMVCMAVSEVPLRYLGARLCLLLHHSIVWVAADLLCAHSRLCF